MQEGSLLADTSMDGVGQKHERNLAETGLCINQALGRLEVALDEIVQPAATHAERKEPNEKEPSIGLGASLPVALARVEGLEVRLKDLHHRIGTL